MNQRQMRELEAQETSQTAEIVNQLRAKIARGSALGAAELYPELSLDPPYTYCTGIAKPSVLLPFFSTLIVDLRPLPTEKAFEERYGLTPYQFIEYVEQGRIVVRLRDRHDRFAGIDYLDPIFASVGCPPSSVRYKALYSDEHAHLLPVAKSLLKKTVPKDNWWSREYSDWKSPPAFQDVFADKFALVGAYFGEDIATSLTSRALKSTGDPGIAYKWLHVFSRARVYPYMNCLDGVNALSLEDLHLTQGLPGDIVANPRAEYATRRRWFDFLRRQREPKTFPYDLGRLMLTNLHVALPDKLDSALQVMPSDWLAAVRELDKALTSESQPAIQTTSRRLIRLIEDVSAEAERMRKRQKAFSSLITLVGVGIVGPLSEYAPAEWKPIVQAAGASLVLLKDPTARLLTKLAKPSHVAAWFNLVSELRPLNEDQ